MDLSTLSRWQKKHLRQKPLAQVKTEILSLLPTDEFNPYDLAMALELPLKAVISALAELEREQKIKPLGDGLRSETIGDLCIELVSAGRRSANSPTMRGRRFAPSQRGRLLAGRKITKSGIAS